MPKTINSKAVNLLGVRHKVILSGFRHRYVAGKDWVLMIGPEKAIVHVHPEDAEAAKKHGFNYVESVPPKHALQKLPSR